MASLFEQIRNRLQQDIARGRYAVGDVLPSIEDLASTHQCSTGTVRRAVAELAQLGLLRPTQRKGTVVTDRPPRGHVCLLLAGDEHMNLMFQQPLYEALHQGGYHVDLLPFCDDAATLRMRMERVVRNASGGESVLVSLTLPGNLRRISAIKDWFTHHVIYDLTPASESMRATVCPDLQYMARDVVEHLLAMGHRRIAVVHGHKSETRSWASITAEHARHLIEVAGGVFFPHYLGRGEYESLTRLVLDEGVTAYWALHDHHAIQVMAHLARHGVHVPQRLALVGRHDTPWSRTCSPALTSVSLNIPETVQAIVQVVNEAAEHPHGLESTVKVRPRLVVRGSSDPSLQ